MRAYSHDVYHAKKPSSKGSELRSIILQGDNVQKVAELLEKARLAISRPHSANLPYARVVDLIDEPSRDHFNSSLHVAALRGRHKCAALLLRCGGSHHLKNLHGQTAVDIARLVCDDRVCPPYGPTEERQPVDEKAVSLGYGEEGKKKGQGVYRKVLALLCDPVAAGRGEYVTARKAKERQQSAPGLPRAGVVASPWALSVGTVGRIAVKPSDMEGARRSSAGVRSLAAAGAGGGGGGNQDILLGDLIMQGHGGGHSPGTAFKLGIPQDGRAFTAVSAGIGHALLGQSVDGKRCAIDDSGPVRSPDRDIRLVLQHDSTPVAQLVVINNSTTLDLLRLCEVRLQLMGSIERIRREPAYPSSANTAENLALRSDLVGHLRDMDTVIVSTTVNSVMVRIHRRGADAPTAKEGMRVALPEGAKGAGLSLKDFKVKCLRQFQEDEAAPHNWRVLTWREKAEFSDVAHIRVDDELLLQNINVVDTGGSGAPRTQLAGGKGVPVISRAV